MRVRQRTLWQICHGSGADLAAAVMKVSARSVDHAAEVRRNGIPELNEAVRRGEVSVRPAAEIAGLPPDEQREALAGGRSGIAEKAKKARQRKMKKVLPTPRARIARLEPGRYASLEQRRVGLVQRLFRTDTSQPLEGPSS